ASMRPADLPLGRSGLAAASVHTRGTTRPWRPGGRQDVLAGWLDAHGHRPRPVDVSDRVANFCPSGDEFKVGTIYPGTPDPGSRIPDPGCDSCMEHSMSDQAVREFLAKMLSWEDAHAGFDAAVEGIPQDFRGKRGGAHSPWELVEHMRIAQHD